MKKAYGFLLLLAATAATAYIKLSEEIIHIPLAVIDSAVATTVTSDLGYRFNTGRNVFYNGETTPIRCSNEQLKTSVMPGDSIEVGDTIAILAARNNLFSEVTCIDLKVSPSDNYK